MRYLETMKKTLDYVLREMTSAEGGFYSAQDADSEGEEGKFYVWSKHEIKEILGDDADAFCLFYDVTDGGNWEGKSILCNNINLSTVAFQCGKSEDEIRDILDSGSKKLLEVRSKRIAPGLDDKVLTSWNALMITAFAKGFRVSNDDRYLNAAENCVNFINSKLFNGEKLLRTYKNGHAKINGYLEDYAYYANSLLDVFEINPQKHYLEKATSLGQYLVDHFWDSEHKSFFMTADNHEKLIIRPKSNYDLSLPSGNSVAAHLMMRLFHFTQEKKFLDISLKILESQAQLAAENPFGYGYLLNTIFLYMQKPTEITILNSSDKEITNTLSQKFIPESFLVTVNSKEQLESLSSYPFFEGKEFKDKTNVFVCKDFTCSLPLETISQVEELL